MDHMQGLRMDVGTGEYVIFQMEDNEEEPSQHPQIAVQYTSGNETSEYKYWSVDHTRLLIEMYGKYKHKVGTMEIRNAKKLWEIIAAELNKLGLNVTPSNCENRWKVLDRNYKKYIDNKNKTGRGRKDFIFSEDMDRLFKKKRNIAPEILLSNTDIDPLPSTSRCSEKSSEYIEKNEDKENTALESKRKVRKSKTLLNKNSILEKIRLDKKIYYDEILRMGKEKLEINKEKLKEIKRRNDLLEERNALLKKD